MGNRPSRSLSRPVAPIEWTLIMRFCPQKDLLRLARCSRTTLSAASNPIAWADRPPIVVALSKLPRGVERSLVHHLPLALHWTLLPSRQFMDWYQQLQPPCVPHESALNCAPPLACSEEVAVIRALPSLVSLHITGPLSLREPDWSGLWSVNQAGRDQCRIQEITLKLTCLPDVQKWRNYRSIDSPPLDHLPPSLLRFSRRDHREGLALWRSTADQPWIKLIFDFSPTRFISIALFELHPALPPDTGASLERHANVRCGSYKRGHADSLVMELRGRLSLDALMIHRGADELNGLRLMARCLREAILADPTFPIRSKP